MKKFLLVFLVALFIGGSASLASANLILNSGFETYSGINFANWQESGSVGVSLLAHSGSAAASLQSAGEVKSNKFNLELGLYEYGAWFKLESESNPTGVSPQDRTGATTNIYFSGGGATWPNAIYDLASFPGVSWTYDVTSGHYFSDWMLFRQTFNVTTFNVTQPVFEAELNLYLQNYNAIYSAVMVDDAFVQRVPEPATMLLLGIGLLGLAGVRRRFKK